MPPRIRLFLKRFDHFGDLIYFATFKSPPVAPLVAVDRAELAVLVGPLVPDGNAALLQPLHVRIAAQEPQELVEDGLEVQLFRGEKRERRVELEAKLPAEDRLCAGAGAVGLARAALEHFREQVEVLLFLAVHTAISPKSSRALWNRSSGFLASSRSS